MTSRTCDCVDVKWCKFCVEYDVIKLITKFGKFVSTCPLHYEGQQIGQYVTE